MAKQTITTLVDDIDGGEAHETIMFAYDGVSYTIDLSDKNALRLREALAPYVENGVKIKAEKRSTRRSSPTVMSATRLGADESREDLAAWAESRGETVAPRGRIKAGLVEEWRAAGRPGAVVVKRPAKKAPAAQFAGE